LRGDFYAPAYPLSRNTVPSSRFNDAFNKLAAAEERFLAGEFLAPVVERGLVHVRIAGIVNRLRCEPRSFTGFGIFKPVASDQAVLVRPATLTERRKYLELFPLVRLIVCQQRQNEWLAMTAHRGDQRFQIAGLVPVRLIQEAQLFEVIRARFDGHNFWYESSESSRDPATAAWLRKQLADGIIPNQLDRRGLTLEERLAYAVHFVAEQQKAAERAEENLPEAQVRLREALRHAGAELVDYLERDDGFRVTYSVAGQQHVSAVNKNDLTVQVAGICLSGEDQKFDLASLVGVLREADGDVLRIGDAGLPEEQYWNVHPPR
jgi:hypothetical protein